MNYLLVVNKDYIPGEGLLVLTIGSDADVDSFHRFFVIPDNAYLSGISLSHGTKRSGKEFYYIMDRVGTAAIDLILYNRPSENEVSIGSLAFQPRTYAVEGGSLELRPPAFYETLKNICSYVKRSARPVCNKKVPRTVYIFPRALELLRQDPSRSPWPSLEIPV